VHVQDFPARYSPQMGFEGANVLFDSWVHPLMMGLEEHLLGMFRDDFEFHDEAAPSHLGTIRSQAKSHSTNQSDYPEQIVMPAVATSSNEAQWTQEAAKELQKIPFFVRGKAKRNTEKFATEQGVSTITVETLYDAKAHYSR